MKPTFFKYSLLTVGVATAMGVNSLATAATSGNISSSDDVTVQNQATATYSVDNQAQPEVESNTVTVFVDEVANFSLIATQGADADDDINEDQSAHPGGTTTFEHRLTNNGNIADTYTLTLTNDNASSLTTDETDEYSFSGFSAMTVTIYNADNTVASTTTVSSGGTVELQPGQYATISYTATTPDSALAGQTDASTLTATSTYIGTVDSASASLINEDQAIVTLPIFSIAKSASDTNIDLNNDTAFSYTIVVTNEDLEYSEDATNITILDDIPDYLAIDTSTITVTGGGSSVVTTESTADILEVSGVDIATGDSVTISFTVNITDAVALAAAGSVTNNASVYDSFHDTEDPTTDPDIMDSTDESTDTDTNPVTDDDDSEGGNGGDTTDTVTFSNRSITVDGGDTQELPPTSADDAPAEYTTTITNNGNQAESGLTFTITDSDTGDNITVGTVTYDPTPATPNSGDEVTLTADGNGVYTIPGEIAANGGTGSITYTVETDDATPDTNNTTVQIIPADGANNDAPTVATVIDTTEVKAMTLLKEQARDEACDGTADAAFSTADLNNVIPGQCIVYRITATNPFTDKVLTNVTISDAASRWSAGATYVANSAVTSTDAAGAISSQPTGTPSAGTVAATFASIPGTAATGSNTGTLTFSVQINVD